MAAILLVLLSMMHVAVLPPIMANAKFNYFDIVAVIWLIIGLFWGRKKGLSQELLPLLQWIGIVAAGGLLYRSLSPLIRQNTQFTELWSNIAAYLIIAAGVHLLYLWFKQMLAARLVEKDPFGRAEFYLGMTAGVARFGCMLLVAMSLMNSRVETAAELASTERFQKDNFSDIRFPTYGELQQDVLFKSFSGTWVQSKLKSVLIASVNASPPPTSETIAQKSNRIIDDILNGAGKK